MTQCPGHDPNIEDPAIKKADVAFLTGFIVLGTFFAWAIWKIISVRKYALHNGWSIVAIACGPLLLACVWGALSFTLKLIKNGKD